MCNFVLSLNQQQKVIEMKSKKKDYVIESKGFTRGIGSSYYKKKRAKLLEEIKAQIKEIENSENK